MNLDKQLTEVEKKLAKSIEDTEFDYDYPADLNLHPKSDLHKFIVKQIEERVREAKKSIDSQSSDWKRMDWQLNAYMPADEAEAATKAKDWRKPVCTVIPMQFASLETYLTYLSSVFLNSPIHKFRGMGGPESIISAAKHERLLQRQDHWFKKPLHLQSQWRDALTYGKGVAALEWRKHKGRRPASQIMDQLRVETLMDLVPGVKEGDIIRYLEEFTMFEGTKLRVLDPYKTLFDPNIDPNNIQESEFIGWQWRTSSLQILRREFDPEEMMFNGQYLRMYAKNGHGDSKWFDQDDSGRLTRQGTEDLSGDDDYQAHPVDVVTMFVDLIPEEWGLGKETYPQKWLFSVAADRIVIQAQPCDYMHGMFPVAVAAPNADGHTKDPISHLMMTFGQQQALDWFVRSHIDNVRKSINDMIVVNPAYIEWDDIKNPNPGKLIRVKRAAMSRDFNLDSVIKQLNVQDVTRGHMADAGAFIEMMRQTNGTTDIAMGDLSGLPERPTQAGINAATNGTLSRLQRMAQIIGAQSMQDIAYISAYNNMQYLSQDMVVQIIGRDEERLRRMLNLPVDAMTTTVSQWDLDGNFDVVPFDGSSGLPSGMQALDTLMQTLMAVPENALEISRRFPISNIMAYYLRQNGASEILEMSVDVQPMEQIQQQVQQGNLVPQNQVMPQGMGMANAA